MRPHLFINLLMFLIFQAFVAQSFKNGTLTDVNNNTYNGKFSIDHENSILRFKNEQTNKVFGYSQIQSLTIDGQNVVVKQLNQQPVLLTILQSGKATLYEKTRSLFVIENAGEFITINTSENTFVIPGRLYLAFSDCNSIREHIARVSNFNKSALIGLTEFYNRCAYNEGFELTEKEIRESERFRSDVYNFYAGAGLTVSNLAYRDEDKNILLPQFSVGVLASPGFLGRLQHQLLFGTDVTYGVAQSQTLNPAGELLGVKLHSFVYTIESQFHFNSSNKWQPYLGIGVNFHSDRYKGQLNGERFNTKDGGFNYNLKAGLLLKTAKNSWGISLRYIPEFTSDASFFNSEGIYSPLKFNNSYLSARVEFYF